VYYSSPRRIRRVSARGLATAISLVLAGCAAAPEGAEDTGVSRSGVWWTDAKLVKSVLINYLGFRAENQSVAANTGFGTDVIDLVLLFDAWDKPGDLQALASLSSYYLGAHGGETYSCLVVRKGRAILPELEQEMARRPSECSKRYGDKEGVCFSNETRISRLRGMIERIESNQTCTVEQ
jgi:hypothetical protein